MRKNKKVVSIIALALALIMVIGIVASLVYSAVVVNAATVSELESQKAQAEQKLEELKSQQSGIAADRNKLKSKITELESESAAFEEQKKALDEQVELTLEMITNIESQLDTYDTLIEEKELELAEAEEEQAYQLERYKTRLRAMEEDGNLSYFSILFSAYNFSDLLTKIYDIQEIIEYDKMVAEQLEEATLAVENAKARLEETKAELEETRTELENTKAQLEEDVAEAQAKINDLQADIDQSEADLDALKKDEERVNAEIDSQTQSVADLNSSIKEAIAKAEAEAAAKKAAEASSGNISNSSPQGPSSGSKTPTGNFIWPTSSTTVTSNYGYRTHPITGAYKLHAGVDISAPTGTAIYAAASGEVITSTYSSSYGYYILINHGNGVYTLYAHCSALYVSAGEAVIQGQTIGAVGSTGNSTGPHLHFEVRINGLTVNPMNYYS